MIETYILLNRQPKITTKLFIYINLFLIILIIYVLTNYQYTIYFNSNAQIKYNNNQFLAKIKTSNKNIKTISQNNKIIINNKEYTYKIYNIDEIPIYEDNQEHQIVYLKIYNLEDYYKIDNYSIDIKIEKSRQKIFDYLKKKEEQWEN